GVRPAGVSRPAQVAQRSRRSVASAPGLRPAGATTAEPKRASTCEIIHGSGGGEMVFNRETVESLLESHDFFWLDLNRPSGEDFSVLRDVFEFHPLAVEDSEQFDQRGKIDGLRRLRLHRCLWRSTRRPPIGRSALLLLRTLPRHRPSRGLPGIHSDPKALSAARAGNRAAIAAALPRHRRARRQLLRKPRRLR